MATRVRAIVIASTHVSRASVGAARAVIHSFAPLTAATVGRPTRSARRSPSARTITFTHAPVARIATAAAQASAASASTESYCSRLAWSFARWRRCSSVDVAHSPSSRLDIARNDRAIGSHYTAVEAQGAQVVHATRKSGADATAGLIALLWQLR